MPNLYGVSNAPGLPQIVFPLDAGNVSCPPGVYTAIGSSPPMVAPSAGYFYCMVWGNLLVLSGATVPTGFTVGLSIGAGSVGNNIGLGANAAIANQTLILPFMLPTTPSQIAWQGSGSTVSVFLQPGANAVTCYALCNAVFCLFRAPDQ